MKTMIKICKSKSVDILWVFLFIVQEIKKQKLRSKVPLIALTIMTFEIILAS